MFDIGFQELIVIFLVALFVLGPEKLPEAARSLGKLVAHLKRSMGDLKSEMDKEINAAKYTVTEHQVPNLRGEPVTLKSVTEKEEPSPPAGDKAAADVKPEGSETPVGPPIDGEPAPVERPAPEAPLEKGAVAPAPTRPQTSAWPTATSVQPEPHSEQREPESEKHDAEGKA